MYIDAGQCRKLWDNQKEKFYNLHCYHNETWPCRNKENQWRTNERVKISAKKRHSKRSLFIFNRYKINSTSTRYQIVKSTPGFLDALVLRQRRELKWADSVAIIMVIPMWQKTGTLTYASNFNYVIIVTDLTLTICHNFIN